MYIKGGLKKKNKQKMLFQPIYDMIIYTTTTFNVLTISSLKGFMINMNVDSNSFEYLQQNDSFKSFNKPVLHYLFKFAIVSPAEENLPAFSSPLFGRPVNKATDSKLDFFNESKLQQNIWIDSITGGKIPICPSVANLSFFKNDASNLLNYIKTKPNSTSNCLAKLDAVSNYLIPVVRSKPNYELGMIVQNLIDQSTTFYDFYLTATPEKKREALVFSAAQLVRLYLNHRIIHLDLHLGNILVSNTGDIKCFIIDFGRVLNFRDKVVRDIDNPNNKDSKKKLEFLTRNGINVVDDWNNFTSELSKRRTRIDTPLDGGKLIEEILEKIADVDHAINNAIFGLTQPQMGDLLTKIYVDKSTYTDIYDKFRELNNVTDAKLTPTTIQNMKTQNEIELIDDTLLNAGAYDNTPFTLSPTMGPGTTSPTAMGPGTTDPYASLPVPDPSPECEKGMCAISGGKKYKKYRTHKGRKTRKRRKTYKKRKIHKKC